jgi:flagellar biogenesis protein FliO
MEYFEWQQLGAKRSLADSFTIVSVASIRIVLGSAQHIHKLHLLDSVAWDLQRFCQNGNMHKIGTAVWKGFGKPGE